MKACEGKTGRVFVIRLEDDDVIPECIEHFAAQKGISAGHVILVEHVGQDQIVDMALVAGHKDDRSFMGHDFNAGQAVVIHRSAVKHRVGDPLDDHRQDLDYRRIIVRSDFSKMIACPFVDFLKGHLPRFCIGFHEGLEGIVCQHTFPELLFGFQIGSGNALTMPVDLTEKSSSQIEGLLLCIQSLRYLSVEKTLQIQGLGYFDIDFVGSVEKRDQASDVSGS